MKKVFNFLMTLFVSLLISDRNFGFAYADVTELAGVDDIIYDEEGNPIDEDEILEGLGAVARKAGNTRMIRNVNNLKRFVRIQRQRATQQRYVAENTTKGQRYIVGKQGELPSTIQNEINKGNIKFTDRTLYHIAELQVVSAITELIKTGSTTKYERGYSSFEEHGKIEANTVVAVEYIELWESAVYDSSSSNVFAVDFEPAWEQSELAACMLVIEQDSIEIARIPVWKMCEARIYQGNVVANGTTAGFNLEQKLLLKPGAKIQAKLETPDGVTYNEQTGNNKFGLKVAFSGSGTTNRSK